MLFVAAGAEYTLPTIMPWSCRRNNDGIDLRGELVGWLGGDRIGCLSGIEHELECNSARGSELSEE